MQPPDPVPQPDFGDTTAAAELGGHAATTIGPYRLIHTLGVGGMGEVWLAEQTRPVHRVVALKVIKPGMDSRQVMARFEAERQALALMVHPAIAAVFDGGTTEEGRPYFAMEYVKGEPLTTYCDRHRVGVQERLALFQQVCEAVQHAHQKGVIHRDLKPSNVLVTIIDDRVVPKIIDFGVAKAIAQPLTERTLFTEMGLLIGTPEYMSPEQAEMGTLDVDTRTDVYALGVIFYELLTGSLPLDRAALRHAGLDGIRRLIRDKEPLRPSTRVTRLGPASTDAARNRHTEPGRLARLLRGDLDWIAMKALEKDRTRRYGSASDLAADVRRHLRHEPVLAGPPSTLYRLRKFVRRHPAGLAVSTAVLMIPIAFGLAMTLQARRVAAERDVAARERDRAEQVSSFLVSLFQASDPDKSKGDSITARDLLDRGVQRLESELKDQPQTRATLLHTIGAVYRALGSDLAAQNALETALAARRNLRGHERADLADTVNELGRVYGSRGDLERSEAMYREALQLRKEVLGPDHLKIAQSLNNLGTVAFARGRMADAEQHFRDAVDMGRRVASPAEVAALQISLASALSRQDRSKEAIDLLRESTAMLKRSLGVEHTRTQIAMNNFGRQLFFAGQYREAEGLQREVLRVRRQVLGPEHPEVATALFTLGDTLANQGRFAEAEEAIRESISIYAERRHGPRVGLAWALNALGRLLVHQRRYDDAERTYGEALDLFRKAQDAAPGDRAFALNGLGEVFYARKQFVEAERAFRETLAVRQASRVPASELAWSQSALGRLLCERGSADEGSPLADEALKTRRAQLPPEHWLVGDVEVTVGRCLVAKARFDEAEVILTHAHTSLVAARGPESDAALQAVSALAALYETWGRSQQAAQWRAKGR